MKNSIQISPRFFQVEKQNYSNWKSALVREFVQNSLDSKGCSKIEISISHEDNFSHLTFIDNGEGMSRDVLENVYLVMGETGKTGEGFTGGYGKARTLTNFAQNNYKIISHDYILNGCGASYEIEDSKDFYRGCCFIIETDKYDWETVIKQVFANCSFRQDVYLNGEKINNTIHRGRLVRHLSFGNVYVNKSVKASKVLVRVNCVWMFSKYSNINAQVIIELDPNTSRASLTANRDGLQYKQDNELQAFLNELASETKSALKDKTRHFKKLVNPDAGGFKTKLNNKEINLDSTENKEKNANDIINNFGKVGDFIVNNGANPVDYENLPVFLKDPLLQSMMIVNESNDARRVNLINNFYHPEKWTTKDGTRYQLIREWFAICQIVMEELTKMANQEFYFSVGWVFCDFDNGEGMGAAHTVNNGIHYLLLNPINEDNKLKYSVNDKGDWNALITLACHEVAHVVYTNHNEDFASLMTHLTIAAFRRQKEIFEAIKLAKG